MSRPDLPRSVAGQPVVPAPLPASDRRADAGCGLWLACAGPVLLLAACSGAGDLTTPTSTPGIGVAPGEAPVPCGPPTGARHVILDLEIAAFPGDEVPPPTDMNGLVLEVADAGVLARPEAFSWWEAPVDLPFSCPPVGPCRVDVGPVDVGFVATGRPILVRSRSSSSASFWATVSTAIPASAVPDDANVVVATAYVMRQANRPQPTGVLSLIRDANGQMPAGARLAPLDAGATGSAPVDVLAAGLPYPGWGPVELTYFDEYATPVFWEPSLASAWVLAASPGPPPAGRGSWPAAWMAIVGEPPELLSEVVPLDLPVDQLVVLPLVVK